MNGVAPEVLHFTGRRDIVNSLLHVRAVVWSLATNVAEFDDALIRNVSLTHTLRTAQLQSEDA